MTNSYSISQTPLPGGTMYRMSMGADLSTRETYAQRVYRIMQANNGMWMGAMALLERVGTGTPRELEDALNTLTDAGLIEAVELD